MTEKYFYCLLLFFFTRSTILEYASPQWIVWNVGQGQWVTYVHQHHCWHFDFGGEKNPIKEVYKYCYWRENRLILSHPDRDHYIFIKSMKQKLKQLCLYGPSWKKIPLQKVGATDIKYCSSIEDKNKLWTKDFAFFQTQSIQRQNNKRGALISKKDKNILSQIVHSTDWLIPGDAPQSIEKEWLRLTPDPKEETITKLLLGHHGSKTSTSLELLQKLSRLSQCIASSREKKYGHPHRDVRLRLRSFCSLVRTEDWNHLHYFEGL